MDSLYDSSTGGPEGWVISNRNCPLLEFDLRFCYSNSEFWWKYKE